MTSRRQSQCGACTRWRPGLLNDGVQTCSAFPDRIPDEIWANEIDHRQPVEGDHGLRWLSKDGAPFPEYAFTEPQ